jgi:hypothetical protein
MGRSLLEHAESLGIVTNVTKVTIYIETIFSRCNTHDKKPCIYRHFGHQIFSERAISPGFGDAIMMHFREKMYDEFYFEGREPLYTPYDRFVQSNLVECVDKGIDEDPEK